MRKNNSGIHTVIFDLDGTLADSAVLTITALERILPDYGVPVPSIETIRMTIGYSNPEFYYKLFPSLQPDIIKQIGLRTENEESTILSSLSDSLLFDGCLDLLNTLIDLGYCLNIASTGDSGHVFPILDQTGIRGLFDSVKCGQPDKVRMLREMTMHGAKSGYIMVGDMSKDADGARINGILSVGACYGYCDRDLAEFDYYINHPMELPDVISGI